MVHSEARTRLDNLTKIQASLHGFLFEIRKCWIFRSAGNRWRGCRELKQFEFDILVSSVFRPKIGIVCCFFIRIYLQHIARPVESERPMDTCVSSKPCVMNKNGNSWDFNCWIICLDKILFIGHNFWTLKNILTKHHKYLDLIKTMCWEQGWQLLLSVYLSSALHKNRVLIVISEDLWTV